jgi:hypothetical protein
MTVKIVFFLFAAGALLVMPPASLSGDQPVTPTIVIQFSWSTGEGYEIGQERAFTVPRAEQAVVSTEILNVFPHGGGRAPRITGGLNAYFYPGAPVCPDRLVKANGHCFPTDPGTAWAFSSESIAENGNSWKVQVVADGWNLPPGEFTIQGRVTITFTPVLERPHIPQFVVSSPRLGAVYARNDAITITWDRKGDSADRVKITMISEASPRVPRVIVADTENDGSYSWTPEPGIAGRISLVIETLDGKTSGRTGWFSLRPE